MVCGSVVCGSVVCGSVVCGSVNRKERTVRKNNMKKHQNNSTRASALQITLSVALLSVSAILFATSFKAAPAVTGMPQSGAIAQDGFYPPFFVPAAPEQDPPVGNRPAAPLQNGFYPPLPL